MIWSDTKDSNGSKFADHLVVELDFEIEEMNVWVENPKTSNLIQMWSWILPHAELKKWYLEQRVARAGKL